MFHQSKTPENNILRYFTTNVPNPTLIVFYKLLILFIKVLTELPRLFKMTESPNNSTIPYSKKNDKQQDEVSNINF